jgi:effector-binding domain-containing protein
MESFPSTVDRAFPELFGWMGAAGLAFAGAPFIRYLTIDMDRELEIEFGVPISPADAARVNGDDRVHIDHLPAGRYATLIHVGPYDQLVAANARLQDWALDQRLTFDTTAWPDGDSWAARFEIYTTNPTEEPDPDKWEVEITYKLADAP